MANIGDRVTIEIKGPGTLSGASTSTRTLSVGNGARITVSGKIIQDLGNYFFNRTVVLTYPCFRSPSQ